MNEKKIKFETYNDRDREIERESCTHSERGTKWSRERETHTGLWTEKEWAWGKRQRDRIIWACVICENEKKRP